MISFARIFLSCSIVFGLLQACTTKDVQLGSIKKIPPSLIYADDDSTIIGHYSNIDENGENLAPYFCASLKDDLNDLLSQKDGNGNFIYLVTP